GDRPRQPADIGHNVLDDDAALRGSFQWRQRDLAARKGRNLTRIPAHAREPAHRLASFDHHHDIGAGGRGDMGDLAPRQPIAEALGSLANFEEVGGHRAIDPAIFITGRVENAASAGLLGRILCLDVIHGAAGRRDHDISGAHRRGDRFRWFHAAARARRHHRHHRITAHRQGLRSKRLPDRGTGTGGDDDDHGLAPLHRHVIRDDAMSSTCDFDGNGHCFNSFARRWISREKPFSRSLLLPILSYYRSYQLSDCNVPTGFTKRNCEAVCPHLKSRTGVLPPPPLRPDNSLSPGAFASIARAAPSAAPDGANSAKSCCRMARVFWLARRPLLRATSVSLASMILCASSADWRNTCGPGSGNGMAWDQEGSATSGWTCCGGFRALHHCRPRAATGAASGSTNPAMCSSSAAGVRALSPRRSWPTPAARSCWRKRR